MHMPILAPLLLIPNQRHWARFLRRRTSAPQLATSCAILCNVVKRSWSTRVVPHMGTDCRMRGTVSGELRVEQVEQSTS